MKAERKKHISDNIFRIGLTSDLPPYLYSQGYVFNILNFTGLCIAAIRVIYLSFSGQLSAPNTTLLNFAPLLSCLFMMYSMYRKWYVITVYFSFLVVPPVLLFVGLYSHDRAIFLYLLPYLVYSFFFLNSKKKIFIAFATIAAYFISALTIEVINSGNVHPGHQHDAVLEIISLGGVIILAFLSMYSIKFQVWKYQEKIRKQRNELEETKRLMAEQNLQLEQSNSIKDKLFSIISHDLKTPIMSISMLLETDENNDDLVHTIKEILPDLRTEIKKTSDLFDNLLKWARLQIREAKISKEPLNISELTYEVTDSLRKRAVEKGVTIRTAISTSYINADKDVLEIVLRNLITNAIKFSEENDSITISGNWQEDGFSIGVTDTGRGMNPETLDKLQGTHFYSTPGTRNEKGTGLGLIICRDLIQKCSGQMAIESREGGGTKVSILLPQ
jgi:two-component system, sensor histidine kinase and response regulator